MENIPWSILISSGAFVVSCLTAWLTLRRGTLRMTRPTVIYLGADHPSPERHKIFLRALLYTTAKRGLVVENMYATFSHGPSKQIFNVWVYGDDKLLRGSGIFVDDRGVVVNHHFLTPLGAKTQFIQGRSLLEVHAKIVGRRSSVRLLSQELEITQGQAMEMHRDNIGLYFDLLETGYVSNFDPKRVDVQGMIASASG